ncbi:MAG: FIST C-terminal domain-containing protein [Donghicola eburneus]|nr:FIST N-terminal domain-containing protein [Donghicola eburneus]MCI5039394.1 FIST C-terminal domain-containing protein [Donghicola eburneus]
MLDQGDTARFVRVALSRASTATEAVTEAVAQVDRRATCFVMAFVPDHLDREVLASELDRQMGGVPVFGCTTAGQITPEGYETGALMLIAFPRRYFRCASMFIDHLRDFPMQELSQKIDRIKGQFQRTAGWRRFGLVLCDGVSKAEDLLASTLQLCLGEIPIYGGSAGDGLQFQETCVLYGGQFHSGAALVLLVETALDFTGVGFDHFLPTETLMVVTSAIPEERVVLELNGAPAALEYSRKIGVAVDQLSPEVFAENPVLVRQNAKFHVRAIHSVEADHGLSFMGAIDDGLILTLGTGTEIINALDTGLDLRGPMGQRPDFILGFDCILRKLEFTQKGMLDDVSAMFRKHNVLGFNTYGEQHCGVHVNQTFVGIAFFEHTPEDLH